MTERMANLLRMEAHYCKMLRDIRDEIRQCQEEEAPLCEGECGKKLWSFGVVHFFGVTETNGTPHRFCSTCADKFILSNKGNIKGAWELPDPMGR